MVAAGFHLMLADGVLALLGMVMICPAFVPSRWRPASDADLGLDRTAGVTTRRPGCPPRPGCCPDRRSALSRRPQDMPDQDQWAAVNCSLSVDPASATVDACGLMAEVTRSK